MSSSTIMRDALSAGGGRGAGALVDHSRLERRVHSGTIRVAYFVAEYRTFGGSQRSLLEIARAMPMHGVEPLGVFPGRGRCTEMFEAAGIATLTVPAPQALNLFGKHHIRAGMGAKLATLVTDVIPYSLQVARALADWAVDVIHYNTPRGMLMTYLTPSVLRRPSVLHIRGVLHGLGRGLVTACMWRADSVLLVSKAVLSGLAIPRVGVPPAGRWRDVGDVLTLPRTAADGRAGRGRADG